MEDHPDLKRIISHGEPPRLEEIVKIAKKLNKTNDIPTFWDFFDYIHREWKKKRYSDG